MKNAMSWIVLALLAMLTIFEGLLLALGQFGHDFNTGGPNPSSLQYGWMLLALRVAALLISRRSSLPLLGVAILNWVYGILMFQMSNRHLSFLPALGAGWMETSFLLLAIVYVATTGARRPERPT